MKLANFEINDLNIKKFLSSSKSLCPGCSKRYHKVGWTSLMGMRTGVTFGCNKGHKKDPRVIIVPLQGKEKYFNGVLLGV